MTKVLAFFGNRQAPLSRAFFRGLLRARAQARTPFDLVLVDTATAAQASWRARARHRSVSAIKSLCGAGVRTSTIDWFGDPEARALPRITPPGHDLASPGLTAALTARAAQALLVAGCDQILREPLVSAVPRVVNFHNGLLPEYRGVQAVEWAFLNRESVAGYTFHTIEGSGIDRGRVVLRRELPIRPGETLSGFDLRLVEDAVGHLGVVLETLLAGSVWPPAVPPMEGGAYYSAKRMRRVRRFDPSLPAEETLHRFRVLQSLDLPSRRVPLKITALGPATEQRTADFTPGRWMRAGRAVAVRCADDWVEIGGIDYLPAAALSWLLPRVIEPPMPSS